MSSVNSFIFAGCQVPVTENKDLNHKTAEEFVRRAVTEHSAKVVALPECWNCPYSNKAFPDFAEDLTNLTGKRTLCQHLSSI